MIELLAPAKDKICAKAAIDYGADAVYIGASSFGARQGAPNSFEDICEIVEYAHKFHVKVYVAINTILNDDELVKAKALAKDLAKIGVDAFIVQDMGLFEQLKDLGVKINASTQCDNRTNEKVKFLEDVGFSRVILARELSVEQIKEIRKNTNVELESFIHGALCVSYSGQCYLSYAIGKRSANRGECAQPCRKKYSLVDETGKFIAKDKYLLCLKDFNASKHIKELAEAGITSFKIEGRLKDANYVKNVVAYYRKLIDNLAISDKKFKKTSSGKIFFDFEPNLEKSFNRGFTDYFVDGKRKEIFSFDTPKAKGEYVGKVAVVGHNYFEIKSKLNISSQDGLCFSHNGEFSGFLVNKVEQNKIYPNKMPKIAVGTDLYRNVDSEFEKALKNSKTCRKICADIEFDLGKIKITDEDEISTFINYEFDEIAKNAEKMRENIINQMKKSGESLFNIENVKICTEKLPFLPVSRLNELSRVLLAHLEAERLKKYQRPENKAAIKDNPKYINEKLDYSGNVLNKSAKEFYKKHGCEVVEPALESGGSCKSKTVMTTKHCLKYAFNMCKSPKKLFLIDEKGKRYELKFNCKKCEMEIIF